MIPLKMNKVGEEVIEIKKIRIVCDYEKFKKVLLSRPLL